MQEKIMLLSYIFGNRLVDFINISNKENIINRYQIRSVISFKVLSTRKNSVISNSQLQKKVWEKNRFANHFKVEEKATKRKWVTSYSKIKKEIEDINSDMSEVRFFNQEIIKYN